MLPYQFYGKNNKAKYKYQQAEPVDAVHVFYKRRFWPVGIGFFYIEVFSYLFPHSHKAKLNIATDTENFI